MPDDEIDIAYRLLDLDLVDSDEFRCGKVDDIELTGEPGETAYVGGLVSGYGALPQRFPRRLRGAAARIFRERPQNVGWERVEDFDSRVELTGTAKELGLGLGDRDPWRPLRRLTGS